MALDLWLDSREFDFQPPHCQATCTSVTQQNKPGVALTGRNTTPRAATWWVELCCICQCYRRQLPLLVCRRASNNVGTGQRAVIPYDWEGNRRSGVILAIWLWVVHPPQRSVTGDEYDTLPTLLRGVADLLLIREQILKEKDAIPYM